VALHIDISGRKGIVAGLVILGMLGVAMLMLHFTLFGAGFTVIYIAVVAILAEYINKRHHPGDIIMASLILLAAGIYLLTINYFHIYDFTGFITTTVMSAILWTAVAEPIAQMLRSSRREVRHYVREEEA
jgi:membrane protein implicated in regulation of membrane protease activity